MKENISKETSGPGNNWTGILDQIIRNNFINQLDEPERSMINSGSPLNEFEGGGGGVPTSQAGGHYELIINRGANPGSPWLIVEVKRTPFETGGKTIIDYTILTWDNDPQKTKKGTANSWGSEQWLINFVDARQWIDGKTWVDASGESVTLIGRNRPALPPPPLPVVAEKETEKVDSLIIGPGPKRPPEPKPKDKVIEKVTPQVKKKRPSFAAEVPLVINFKGTSVRYVDKDKAQSKLTTLVTDFMKVKDKDLRMSDIYIVIFGNTGYPSKSTSIGNIAGWYGKGNDGNNTALDLMNARAATMANDLKWLSKENGWGLDPQKIVYMPGVADSPLTGRAFVATADVIKANYPAAAKALGIK